MALYIARDKNGDLYLFDKKPYEYGGCWITGKSGYCLLLPRDMFPKITYIDGPKKVSLMLRDLKKNELELMDDKIKELESLNYEGWDGYNAMPVDKKSIENLKALFRITNYWNFDKWQIAPGVNGNICLNYKLDYPNANIIIEPDEFTYVIETDASTLKGGTNKFNSQEVIKIMNDIHNISQNNK